VGGGQSGRRVTIAVEAEQGGGRNPTPAASRPALSASPLPGPAPRSAPRRRAVPPAAAQCPPPPRCGAAQAQTRVDGYSPASAGPLQQALASVASWSREARAARVLDTVQVGRGGWAA
jgi:hypothetical protein